MTIKRIAFNRNNTRTWIADDNIEYASFCNSIFSKYFIVPVDDPRTIMDFMVNEIKLRDNQLLAQQILLEELCRTYIANPGTENQFVTCFSGGNDKNAPHVKLWSKVQNLLNDL